MFKKSYSKSPALWLQTTNCARVKLHLVFVDGQFHAFSLEKFTPSRKNLHGSARGACDIYMRYGYEETRRYRPVVRLLDRRLSTAPSPALLRVGFTTSCCLLSDAGSSFSHRTDDRRKWSPPHGCPGQLMLFSLWQFNFCLSHLCRTTSTFATKLL